MSIMPTAAPASASAAHGSTLASSNSPSTSSNITSSTSSSTANALNAKEDHHLSHFANLSVAALSTSYSVGANKLSSSTIASPPLAPQHQHQQQQQQQPPPAPPAPTTQQNQQNNFVYDDINIFMWSVCKICNKSTRKMIMSPDTWSFSLAKFLKLTFHTRSYTQFNADDEPKCQHSLFQDHYQYFRFKNIVTVFSTSKISTKTLSLPPMALKCQVNLIEYFNMKANILKNMRFSHVQDQEMNT